MIIYHCIMYTLFLVINHALSRLNSIAFISGSCRRVSICPSLSLSLSYIIKPPNESPRPSFCCCASAPCILLLAYSFHTFHSILVSRQLRLTLPASMRLEMNVGAPWLELSSTIRTIPTSSPSLCSTHSQCTNPSIASEADIFDT